jgi:para-nitrobenzyl esterase
MGPCRLRRAVAAAFWCAGLVLSGGGASAQPLAPVEVDGGLLQGFRDGGLAIYRGIPYAAPPVGELRWRPPQPAAKWDGVRAANGWR